MTKITELPIANTMTNGGLFVIYDNERTRRLTLQTLLNTGLRGPKGDTGTQGIIGNTGTQGIQGIQGPVGTFNTATLVSMAVTSTYAMSFNTATLVASAVYAETFNTATQVGSAAFAYTFNTNTLVASAVFAYTFNTGTLVNKAVSVINAGGGATPTSTGTIFGFTPQIQCNVMLGYNSGNTAMTGTFNIAAGAYTLGNNTTGVQNIALGAYAMYDNTTGCNNVAIGFKAAQCAVTASNNIAVGHQALQENLLGNGNVALGQCAAFEQHYSYNTAVGTEALLRNCGNYNISIGYCSLYNSINGNNNIGIGWCALGSSATSCNEVTIGNSVHDCYRMYAAGWTNASDCRDKTNICSLPVGLDLVRALRPVKYEWNRRDGNRVGDKDSGFLAQEVLKTIKDYNVDDWLKLANDDDPDNLMISAGYLLPVLTKAVQELANENDQLKARITALEQKLP